MTVHVTVDEALKRAESQVGKKGLPAPWAPFLHRPETRKATDPNDCAYFVTWTAKDNGGRERSDYRNGSIRAIRADRPYKEVGRASGAAFRPQDIVKAGIRRGDWLLLRWEDSGLPDHVGIVTGVAPDGSYVDTIEANTGPKVGVLNPAGVYRRRRYPANIVGAIRPPYEKKD